MPGGRPRTPTNILEARGAFQRNPDRGRARENEPADLPDIGGPPEHLTDEQKDAWRYLTRIAPDGVLTEADAPAVEMAAKYYARLKADEITSPEMKQFATLLGQFGMTPADRSKVSGRPKKNANKFKELG